jgi:hypothetical protein
MPIPRNSLVRNFTGHLNAAQADPVSIFLVVGLTTRTFCTIPVGQTSCTAPAASLAAGEQVNVSMTENGNSSGFAFAYELWSPSAVPAATLAAALDTATRLSQPAPTGVRR